MRQVNKVKINGRLRIRNSNINPEMLKKVALLLLNYIMIAASIFSRTATDDSPENILLGNIEAFFIKGAVS